MRLNKYIYNVKIFQQYLAFTLAEVLITLGIIGIVAAMTIPVLIKNTQNAELKTAFKKSYTNLMQAYNLVTLDNGNTTYRCYYSVVLGTTMLDCTPFWNELKSRLKVEKTYTSTPNGIDFPYHLTRAEVLANGGTAPNGSCNTMSDRDSRETWALADGSMIKSSWNTISSNICFILDTNGMKGPNKWGYDLFILDWGDASSIGSQIKLEDRICYIFEAGGYRINDILVNK